jgi:hypothetical protein
MTRVDRALELVAPLAPALESPLEVVPALAASSRVARHHGIPDPHHSGGPLELRLPGIGGRYLEGVAAYVTAHGWSPLETAALVAALEERSSIWIACSSSRALVRAGLAAEPARLRRAGAVRFGGGRWRAARLPPAATISELMRAGISRGALCAAAESGRRAPRCVLEAATAGGARTASMERGLAAALGARWAVELLVAPAIPSGSLVALREQIAAAPRCAWCRTPLIGSTCRRCSPAVW